MMAQSLIEYKNLTSYITSLPKAVIEKIFNHPTTCLAVFRELPELSKLIVLRLLFLKQEVPQKTVNSWIDAKYQKEITQATQMLTNLGVWQEVRSTQGAQPAWTLKSSFKSNLMLGIFKSDVSAESDASAAAASARMESSSDQSSDAKFIEKLDNYSLERWESILKYIVNPKDAKNQICNSTKDLLKFAGLMKTLRDDDSREAAEARSSEDANTISTSGDDNVILTSNAFQFLLWSRRLQIWYLILQLLEYSWQKNNLDLSECLILLFELSFSTFGKDYSCENFSNGRVEFLQELRKLGLVFMRTRKIKLFHPTRLAIQLANGVDIDNEVKTEQDGFIIVETNYRVYAYTNSHLQISLLALFCDLLYKFPNMVVGVLTRESVREAFKMGITAHQIISFLRSNAHPQIATKKPVLPETVMDQINFWYNEKNRLKYFDGFSYGQFNSDADFLMLKNYAKSIDGIIWSHDAKRLMFVKRTAHESIRKFWKQNKPKNVS